MNNNIREGDIIIDTHGKKFLDLILIIKIRVKRLKLIVVSNGESFITTGEWVCIANPVYIHVILFI